MQPRPNFLYIGMPKAGTNWLSWVVRQHPKAFVPFIFNPCYFDRFYDKGFDWYLGFFKDAAPDAVAIGEFSHDYIYSEQAAERIDRDLPGVRLLACVRNPFDQIVSAYFQRLQSGYAIKPFPEHLAEDPSLLAEPQCAATLKVYLERFGPDRIKVQLFDSLTADAKAYALETFAYLGLEPVDSIQYEQVINPSEQARNAFLARLVRFGGERLQGKPGFATAVAIKQHPLVWKLLFRRTRPEERFAITRAQYPALTEVLTEEVHRLEALLGLDLSHWLPAS
jgi:hypothetical protein